MSRLAQDEKRVVVTGLGVVSSLGIGAGELWKNLIAGRSGISEASTVRAEGLRFHKAGVVKNFDAVKLTSSRDVAQLGRTSQFAVAASYLALSDAGLYMDGKFTGGPDPELASVVMGTTTGEQQALEDRIESRMGLREEKPFRAVTRQIASSVVSTNISDFFCLGGHSIVLPAACSGGNYAIAHAYDLLRAGRASVILAGGADCLSRHFLYGFARLRALAPERCQPFDKNRKGIIPGEGAGVLVLETLESASARKAHIYSEVLGYGLSSDAHHPVAPDPEGRGAAQSMRDALAYSHTPPESVQYISAHGTGTQVNDAVETIAIKRVFGDYAYHLPISSVKSMLGHPASAASALEAVTCNLVIHSGEIPPTINYDERDPECDLDYVPNVARRAQVDIAMNNSQAFLGSNASVLFGRVRP
ncbi:MAG TPA: beta-ketoacyl-[acyl-carrier-protein] synthase family protein [Blastocatellia bacterium]|nr:beta-ketoacyl-[acyl-carrier-protein] synthase family protein [Blastocatellia bacterium]